MTVSMCFEDTQFTLVQQQVKFEQAEIACESRNATVARISSSSEHKAIKLLLDKANQNEELWLGLIDLDQIGGNDTERFTFVDGSEEGLDFFTTAGQFPWGPNQPNDLPPSQYCVA